MYFYSSSGNYNNGKYYNNYGKSKKSNYYKI